MAARFYNFYGCRHSLPDGIMRSTDVMIGGNRVLACAYGDVGTGFAFGMRGAPQGLWSLKLLGGATWYGK